MSELEKKLDLHIAHDAVEFKSINEKLDKLLVEVTTLKTQWKMIVSIASALVGSVGLIAGWIWG